MKRVLPLILIGTILVAIGGPAQSDPPQSPDSPKSNLHPLMQMKLDKAKEILEGLTLEDFDKIGRNARSLRLLSAETGWNVIQTEEYATQSRDFQRTCDLISEAAAEKDISRAALGYVAMTVRCVECHAYMRKHRAEQDNSETDAAR
jgi:hypothetical protein